MANPKEHELHYPLGDSAAGPRRARSRSRPACAGCAWRCRSRSTTSTCGCCATASTAATAGPSSTAASRNDATRAAWEQVFATQLRGPAGAARDRHPHAPRPHRPGALADRALGLPAVDQRHRLQRGAPGAVRRTTGFGGEQRGRVLRQPRPDRSRTSLEKVRARTELLRQHGAARCRRSFRRLHGRHDDRHRRARLALHRRLRPCAGAHRAVLRRR